MGFGKNVRKLRKEKDMTIQELATALGFKVSRIQKWETEQAVPSEKVMRQVAEYFGISVDEICKESVGSMVSKSLRAISEPPTNISSEIKRTLNKLEDTQKNIEDFLIRFDGIDLDIAIKYQSLNEANQQIVKAQIEFLLIHQDLQE